MVILFENINKGEWLQTITDGIRNSVAVDVTEQIELILQSPQQRIIRARD